MSLGGKRVVVTGGAAGIGLAMARAFRDAGARVAVCDADAAAVKAVDGEKGLIARVADVTDERATAAFFGKVETALGGVDILCANAGTGGPAGPIETLGLEDWRACLSVNLDGAFLACRWAAAR
ncbi:MAG: SDR family NAD(P)-dependent oxidoreductase, partial [Pseudomonadota bacterium]